MKPEHLRKPSTFLVHTNTRTQNEHTKISYLSIYEEAKLRKHWIYDPDIKRWQTPEEFLELEQKLSGGESNRLSKLQIRDPLEGIEASYIQLQSLKERMEIFVKRVIDYYKTKL